MYIGTRRTGEGGKATRESVREKATEEGGLERRIRNAPRKVSKKNLSLSFRIPDIFYRFVKAAAG
jgi:hypothetical protein